MNESSGDERSTAIKGQVDDEPAVSLENKLIVDTVCDKLTNSVISKDLEGDVIRASEDFDTGSNDVVSNIKNKKLGCVSNGSMEYNSNDVVAAGISDAPQFGDKVYATTEEPVDSDLNANRNSETEDMAGGSALPNPVGDVSGDSPEDCHHKDPVESSRESMISEVTINKTNDADEDNIAKVASDGILNHDVKLIESNDADVTSLAEDTLVERSSDVADDNEKTAKISGGAFVQQLGNLVEDDINSTSNEVISGSAVTKESVLNDSSDFIKETVTKMSDDTEKVVGQVVDDGAADNVLEESGDCVKDEKISENTTEELSVDAVSSSAVGEKSSEKFEVTADEITDESVVHDAGDTNCEDARGPASSGISDKMVWDEDDKPSDETNMTNPMTADDTLTTEEKLHEVGKGTHDEELDIAAMELDETGSRGADTCGQEVVAPMDTTEEASTVPPDRQVIDLADDSSDSRQSPDLAREKMLVKNCKSMDDDDDDNVNKDRNVFEAFKVDERKGNAEGLQQNTADDNEVVDLDSDDSEPETCSQTGKEKPDDDVSDDADGDKVVNEEVASEAGSLVQGSNTERTLDKDEKVVSQQDAELSGTVVSEIMEYGDGVVSDMSDDAAIKDYGEVDENGDQIVGDLVDSLHDTFSSNSLHLPVYDSNNSFKCQQCSTSFDTSEEFQEHVVGHLVQNSLTDETIDGDGWATCPVCLQMFPEMALYEEHLKNHLNNVFKCTVCDKTFHERKALEEHVHKVHNIDRPFKCSECGKMFKAIAMLSKHLQKIHNKEMSLNCNYCSYTCLTKEELERHTKEKHTHKHKKKKRKNKQYTCEVCSRIYFEKKEYQIHKKNGHNRPAELITTPISNDMNDSKNAPDVLIKSSKTPCPSEDDAEGNDEATPSKRRKSNRIAVLETLVCSCALCSKRFPSDIEYRVHLRDQHKAVLNDYGEVVYLHVEKEPRVRKPKRRKSTMSVSSGTSAQSVKERDEEKEREDSSSPSLLEEVESNDPDYRPDVHVPVSSEDEAMEISHDIQPDIEEKDTVDVPYSLNYKCEVCFVSFHSPTQLKRHVVQEHSRPIKMTALYPACPYCSKTFSTKVDVERHLILYHSLKDLLKESPVGKINETSTNHSNVNAIKSCHICRRQFPNQSRLDDHIMHSHRQQRRYNCHLCQDSFPQMPALLSHIRSAHKPNSNNSAGRSSASQQGKTGFPSSTTGSMLLPTTPQPFSQTVNTLATTNNRTPGQIALAKFIKKCHYVCAVCEDGFSKETDLEDHIMSIHRLAIAPNHREKKPYGCLLCNKRFLQLNAITLHLVSYHKQDENDIMGGRRSSEPSDMSEERETHQCLICLEEFSKKRHLDKHAKKNNCRPSTRPKPKKRVIIHDEEERPLSCTRCSGKYWGKAYLYMHMIEVHGNAALGEYMLKKKEEEEAEAEKTKDVPVPYPVALYKATPVRVAAAAGSNTFQTSGGPIHPAGAVLPTGARRQVTATQNCAPNSGIRRTGSTPLKIVPKEKVGDVDVIDLTDDDPPDELEPIPKLSVIRRPPVPTTMVSSSGVRQNQPAVRPGGVGPNRPAQQAGVARQPVTPAGLRPNQPGVPHVRLPVVPPTGIRPNRPVVPHVRQLVAPPTGIRPNRPVVPHIRQLVTPTGKRPNQPPIPRVINGPSISQKESFVDLTEDSDEENVAEIPPKKDADNHNSSNVSKCIHCTETFAEPLQMLIHVYSEHVGSDPVVCAFCDDKFPDRRSLQEHIVTHQQFKTIKTAMKSKDELSQKLPFLFDDEDSSNSSDCDIIDIS